jgi:hypothetical protein
MRYSVVRIKLERIVVLLDCAVPLAGQVVAIAETERRKVIGAPGRGPGTSFAHGRRLTYAVRDQ